MPQPAPEPQQPPPPEPDYDEGFDPHAYAHDNPGYDEEPPDEDGFDTISVLPDEPVPLDAGEFLRSYYAPGIGDVRVYARLDAMDEEPPDEDDFDTISVLPGGKVPIDAGELLRTYYAPGIGDVRIYARLDPDDMDIDPGQVIELDELDDEPAPESTPKPPK